MCRSSAHEVVRKKGAVLMSEAPAREPSRRVSSLIKSLRMIPLQRLRRLASTVHFSHSGYVLGYRRGTRSFGKRHFIAEYVGKGRITILAFERCRSVKHFIDEYAQGPPIDRAGMSASFDDFGCNILLCSYKRVGPEIIDAGLGVDCR